MIFYLTTYGLKILVNHIHSHKKIIKGLLVNTKNANTFTGIQGAEAIKDISKQLAKSLTLKAAQNPVLVIGQEKGDDLDSRIERNFGMMRPEGYRKTIRLMKLADKFNIPIVIFVDTPGAYPGVGAEERGQAEAIAKSIESLQVS